MTEAFGEIFVGEVALVGIDTVPESGVVVEQGFDTPIFSGFDQERCENIADGGGGCAADFRRDIGNAIVDDAVLDKGRMVQ